MTDFRKTYARIFAVHEIEASGLLQLLYYVLALSFFATFYDWVDRANVSISTFLSGGHVCPPYFPSCGEWYFLEALPYGYSQSAFYILLFLTLGYGVYSAYRKDWVSAHAALFVCLIWKALWAFALTYGVTGNFDYYDMGLAIVWLFAREKEYFAKVTFVFYYVLASSIKIDGGWILANYFNSLFTGSPIFGHSTLPLFTNFLILMQMVGAWFLFSNNKWLQRAALVYFLLFHIYSGIIVNYRYITVSIPALFVLFSEQKAFRVKGIGGRTLFGYLFLLFLLCGQLTGILISGDQKKTLEGNYYGLYMFEANHQCISEATIYREDAEPETVKRENHVANNRCDPYRYWFPLKTRCERDGTIERISWRFDHSINGFPYERIVNTEDACMLSYHPLSHNDWLRLDGAVATSTPVYRNGFAFDIDPRIQLPPETRTNYPLLSKLTAFYWTLWALSILFGVLLVLLATIRRR